MTRFFAHDAVSDVDGRVGTDDDDRAQMPGSVPDLVVDWGSNQKDAYVPFMRDSDPLVAWTHSFSVLTGGVLEVSVTWFKRQSATAESWSMGDTEVVRLYSPTYWTRLTGRRGTPAAPAAPAAQSAPTPDPDHEKPSDSRVPRPDGSMGGIPRHPLG